jgi:ABC-type branched-subunit amino acid transport system substrate-binding protein
MEQQWKHPSLGNVRRPAGRRRVRRLLGAAAGGGLSVIIAACGSSAGSGGGTGSGQTGPVAIGVVAPLTGSQAELGKFIAGPCYAAVRVLNAAGGILHRTVSCALIDDLGDPADAVPNVTKALATTSSLAGVIGIDSNVAATVVPLINNAKLPMISTNGLSVYIHNTYPYFWRMTAPDVAGGAAMGLWAAKRGYKRVAVVFQNDVGDLGNKPGLVSALAKSGITAVSDVTIPGDATSYQSVVNNIRTLKPQALLVSADTQTSATLLSEYKGLNNGSVPPLIAPTDVLAPDYFSAVKRVMGITYLTHQVSFVGTYVNTGSPEFVAYDNAMKASPQVHDPATVVATGAVASLYDGANVLALAMEAAKSTSGPVYNKFVPLVTTKRAGAVEVHTFAQGVNELKAGHQIYYVGVGGQIMFDKYHNSPGEFAGFAFDSSANPIVLGQIDPAAIAAALR